MKKRIVLWLLALCLLLAGCQENADPTGGTESVSGCDAQEKYRGITPGLFAFQETDELFFGSNMSGNTVHYYDKTSGISGALCADPSCTHDSLACAACIVHCGFFYAGEGKAYLLQQGDESDYWDYFLYLSDLSGTNRQEIKRISMQDVILEYNPQWFVIHRDKLYFLGTKDIVEGVNTYTCVTLVSTPLDASNNYTVLFEETFDRAVHPYVRFVGDRIYLTMQIFTSGESTGDIRILKIDSKTGATVTVYEETGVAASIDPAWVTEDGMIYLPGYQDGRAYVWKLENGKREEVYSWEAANYKNPDIMDGIAILTYSEDGIRMIDVVDLSGQLLYSGKLFPEAIPGIEGDPNKFSRAFIGGDADKIIINMKDHTSKDRVDYTVMLDLKDNLKATVLWSSQG